MTITNADELRAVYLHTFENFHTSPVEVADNVDSVTNVRFARELLGTLVAAGLMDEVEGEEGDYFQTLINYDSSSYEDAEHAIDTFLRRNTNSNTKRNTAMNATATKDRPKAETFHACYCGCGENVPSKSFYRPGHDARHAGVVGRKVAAILIADPGKTEEASALFNDLPSDRLVAKAEGIAEKAIEKADAKKAREAEREAAKAAKQQGPVEGTVTVGKNERVAHKHPDGRVEYLDAKGEWKDASKAASATFTAAE